jgi:hypothetical protein
VVGGASQLLNRWKCGGRSIEGDQSHHCRRKLS